MSAADVAFARALEHWRAESLEEAHADCLEAIGHDDGHIGARCSPRRSSAGGRDWTGRGAALACRGPIPRRGRCARLLARAQRTPATSRRPSARRPRRAASPGSSDAAAEHALALIALGVRTRRRRPGEGGRGGRHDARALWVVADTLLRLGAASGRLALARARAGHGARPATASWHAIEATRSASAARRARPSG